MNKLTFKEKKFTKEYIKNNGNGRKAVLKSYNTTDPLTASVIASRLLKKDNVQEEMKRILERDECNLSSVTTNLVNIANDKPIKGFSGSDILEANKTLLKLHGVLTDKKTITNVNLNANLNNLSKYELVKLRQQKQRETDSILDGELIENS